MGVFPETIEGIDMAALKSMLIDAPAAVRRETAQWERDALAAKDERGAWMTCSGCCEIGDYGSSEHLYPLHPFHDVRVGDGCAECNYRGIVLMLCPPILSPDSAPSSLLTSSEPGTANEEPRFDGQSSLTNVNQLLSGAANSNKAYDDVSPDGVPDSRCASCIFGRWSAAEGGHKCTGDFDDLLRAHVEDWDMGVTMGDCPGHTPQEGSGA